jgi:hypothetical protein
MPGPGQLPVQPLLLSQTGRGPLCMRKSEGDIFKECVVSDTNKWLFVLLRIKLTFYNLHKYFLNFRSAWFCALEVFGTAILGVLWLQ